MTGIFFSCVNGTINCAIGIKLENQNCVMHCSVAWPDCFCILGLESKQAVWPHETRCKAIWGCHSSVLPPVTTVKLKINGQLIQVIVKQSSQSRAALIPDFTDTSSTK